MLYHFLAEMMLQYGFLLDYLCVNGLYLANLFTSNAAIFKLGEANNQGMALKYIPAFLIMWYVSTRWVVIKRKHSVNKRLPRERLRIDGSYRDTPAREVKPLAEVKAALDRRKAIQLFTLPE